MMTVARGLLFIEKNYWIPALRSAAAGMTKSVAIDAACTSGDRQIFA